jgi:hypothetical protein
MRFNGQPFWIGNADWLDREDHTEWRKNKLFNYRTGLIKQKLSFIFDHLIKKFNILTNKTTALTMYSVFNTPKFNLLDVDRSVENATYNVTI